MITRLKTLARRLWADDTVQRAAHTFWQAAAGSAIATFGGAGLNLGDLADLSVDQKIITSAVVAGLGAVFSLLKGAARARTAPTAAAESSPLLDVPDTPDPLAGPAHDPNTAGASKPAKS